jgi:hypothetical protein
MKNGLLASGVRAIRLRDNRSRASVYLFEMITSYGITIMIPDRQASIYMQLLDGDCRTRGHYLFLSANPLQRILTEVAAYPRV